LEYNVKVNFKFFQTQSAKGVQEWELGIPDLGQGFLFAKTSKI
jgi:hypothetical protein